MKSDNTAHVVRLLRSTANALERGEADWSDYDLQYSIGPHEPVRTFIEIDVHGMKIDEIGDEL